MRRTATILRLMAVALVLTATVCLSSAQAQSRAETFAASASVKTTAGVSITAPVVISITRWTTEAQRTAAGTALKSGGGAALKKALEAMPDAGTIRIGAQTTPLKYARTLSTGSGRLVTVVAAQPILYLGGAQEARAGFDFALATFEVDHAGRGSAGELAPAAKIRMDANGALVTEDYGAEAVRLNDISKK